MSISKEGIIPVIISSFLVFDWLTCPFISTSGILAFILVFLLYDLSPFIIPEKIRSFSPFISISGCFPLIFVFPDFISIFGVLTFI